MRCDVEQLGLRANMTSFIKPEIHNVSLRRQRRTEPLTQVTFAQKPGEARMCSSRDMLADRQTHRQTDAVVIILHCPVGGEVINVKGNQKCVGGRMVVLLIVRQ